MALTLPFILTTELIVVVSSLTNWVSSHWSSVPPVSYVDEALTNGFLFPFSSSKSCWPGKACPLFSLVVSVNSVDPVLNLGSGWGVLYGSSIKKVPVISPKTSVTNLTSPLTKADAPLVSPLIKEFFFTYPK